MASLVQATFEVIAGAQAEIAIFLLAVFLHSVLFGGYKIRAPPKSKLTPANEKSPKSDKKAAGASTRSPLVAPLVRSIRSLLAQSYEKELLAQELERHLGSCGPEEASEALAGLLEVIGKTAPPELLAAVSDELHGHGLRSSGRACEVLLRGYLGLRLGAEFEELFGEVEAEGCVTPAMALLALRAALVSSNLEAAMGQLKRLAVQLRPSLGGSEPSPTPQNLMQQLARLAVHRATTPKLLRELQGCQLLTAWMLEAVLVECSRVGDVSALLAARAFGAAHGVELTAAAYGTLLRTAGTQLDAAGLLREADERGLLNDELLITASSAAAESSDTALAVAMLQRLPKKPSAQVAAHLVRLAAKNPSCLGKDGDMAVLQLCEGHLVGGAVFGGDPSALQAVVEVALRSGMQPIVQRLMALLECSQQQALIKALGAGGDKTSLAAAMETFQACPAKSASLYNAVLDTAIVCRDLAAADKLMKEATTAGMADVVTHNTIIKAFAQSGDLQRARAAVEEMRRSGGALAPNIVTFNELIDATLRCSSDGAWALIEDVKACNLRPNHVTCSILLKNIQRGCRARDIEKTLAVVEAIEQDAMDEVLLSSVCEACVRVGRADLLAKQLERQRGPKRVLVKGAHCFGSVMRAFGFLGDLSGAWELWRDMRAQRIVPTSVTIGCMVEALVSNGDPEAGYELIHQMLSESETKPLVNAVIYCSVLKGFSHQKQFGRVWAVYDEMRAGGVPFSVAAFNALVDTCARSCDMARVPDLIAEMGRQGIQPNVVTYSTILKGYCQENCLDKAFELLEEMKKSKDFRPDEITYNTLIDGCARFGLYDRGVLLVGEMQEFGVRPSNFTLSVLAKLCTRGRRPEKATELCEGLARKYSLQPNVQVYNNLIHACTAMRNMKSAAKVFEQMLSEGVRTDGRTYSLMIKGYISCGMLEEALAAFRRGLGLGGAGSRASERPSGGMQPDLVTEALEAVAAQRGTDAALELLRDVRRVPGMRLDPKLQMRLTSTAVSGSRWS